MCGIAGYIDFSGKGDPCVVAQMVDTLHHRGPDSQGVKHYVVSDAFVGMGQARLSIIDLSTAANQPFESGEYSVIFNGEIYNFQDIRLKLQNQGVKLRTNSDTEVLLESYIQYGEDCVHLFRGMFAFFILDKQSHSVFICRDRIGVKPFYYYYKEGLFIFGSELKALMAHPDFKKFISYKAVCQFIDNGFIPEESCIFESTHKLLPGHALQIDLESQAVVTKQYWNLATYYKRPKSDVSYPEAKAEVISILKDSVRLRQVADVPIGVFLSGGYDSTLVASLMQQTTDRPINTFTIGFRDGIDESPFAKKVANYLGTNHIELDCSLTEAASIIQDLPHYFDEPNADISCIPTFLVCKLARKHVKVAISADGGDEVFAGYSGYARVLSILGSLESKKPLMRMFTNIVSQTALRVTLGDASMVHHKVASIAEVIANGTNNAAVALYRNARLYPVGIRRKLVQQYQDHNPNALQIAEHFNEVDSLSTLLFIDSTLTLPELLLTKVDRASMANSLEVREPLLDHQLIEFVATLPSDYKYSNGQLKKMLKDIVHTMVPSQLVDRPKTGFDLPIYDWLHGDLAYLISEYLSEERLRKYGVFNVAYALQIVSSFKAKKLRYLSLIWRMIVLQMWYERWMDTSQKSKQIRMH